MAGYFELKREETGHFEFVLKAGNHETILSSPLYKTRQDALDGIEAVRKFSSSPEHFRRRVSRDNLPYFVLTRADDEIIGHSERYSSPAAMETGVRSVMANGSSSVIKGRR